MRADQEPVTVRIFGQLQSRNLFVAEPIYRKSHGWLQTASVIVAPRTPILDAEALNQFMDSLVEDIKPTARDSFNGRANGIMDLGKLYFDEVLAAQTDDIDRSFAVYYPDILKMLGFTTEPMKLTEVREFKSRTWLRPYPTIPLAEKQAEYEHSVEKDAQGNVLRGRIIEDLESSGHVLKPEVLGIRNPTLPGRTSRK